MGEKHWPIYGCHVDVPHGDSPDNCVIHYGAPSDCLYGHFASGRPRKVAHTCKYWRKIEDTTP